MAAKKKTAVIVEEMTCKVSDWDQYLFGQGTHYEIYKKLGAHLTVKDGVAGTYFAVWAPRAKSVKLIGEFNGWNGKDHVMTRLEPLGIYEIFVPGVGEGATYKFLIEGADGNMHYKADPYAFHAEMRPGTASKVADISYKWKDSKWMEERREKDTNKMPLSIYEVHPGSWKKHPVTEENPDGYYSYDDLAEELVKYVKEMGYTHVELMGIAEHPFDGSWGYQVTGYFAPTSRYGTPKQFKHLNSCLLGKNPGTIMIAEESTAWPKVTDKPENDGLGFSYKWNMGWMHDFLEYMKLDPYFRKNNHNKMTFAASYMTSENYILVLSHDEVVHLKCSMINKMPGYPDDKFANLKAGYAFMMGHPGKKLKYIGQEFAHYQEWSEARELDWFLLGEEKHQQMQGWVKELLHIYKKHPCLYELDRSYDGFQWINADDADRSIFSFVRYDEAKKKNLLFVMNFTPMERADYRVGVPRKKQYKLILNSHDEKFGGKDTVENRETVYKAVKGECDKQPYSFEYPLPPYGVAVFEF